MKGLIACLALLLFAAPAIAGLSEGVDAYNKHDWTKAIAELTPLANQGNPTAASLLGEYYRGQDDDQAVKWDLVAAHRGDAKMQYEMGVRIDDIAWQQSRLLAVTRDNPLFGRAAECFQMAADQGYAPAQDALGMMYEMGMKLKENVPKGIALYRAAARQGYGRGLQSMASMYEQGRGVKHSLSTAYTLYLTALKHADGDYSVEEFSEFSTENLAPQLSPKEIARAKQTAETWVPGKPLVGI